MVANKDDNQHKVVENMFGDDAGFLSGLGIDTPVEEKKKEVSEKTVDAEPEPIVQEQDIVPELKEARVVSKAAPKSKPKPKTAAPKKQAAKTSGVDDLIDKKRKEASYDSSFRPGTSRSSGGRSGGGARGRGNGGRAPAFSRGKPRAAITLGRTKNMTTAQKAQTVKKKKVYKVSDSLKKKGTITMDDTIVVKEFSEKMGVPLPEVMKVLLANKILVPAHASIDFDTATLVGVEFDVTVERESTQVDVVDILEGNLQAILDQDKEAVDLTSRPPIVTIMGHVDHGKTKLLDYLRKTDIVGGEAGGITQSIGASQIIHNDQKITLIDTPGHELFTSLRARGSKITNIVVVVVAADDGVKPQTIEAINHAKDAGVPMIVAITKIDLGVGKMEEIKGQLAQHGLQPEDWGGDTMIIPLSSMTGQGIDDLLDGILLQYEMLELKYSPSRNAVGVVVEAQRDAKQGVTTSLLVMTGTLKIGDIVTVHNTSGKVRRMTDWTGRKIKQATGGDPVMILGIQNLPEPGRVVEVVNSEKEASKKIAAIKDHEHELSKEAVLGSLLDKIGQGDTVNLKLILKADSFGSLEAIKHAASQVELPENIELKLIHTNVGSITDGDLTFAQAAEAIVVGFNVGASGSLKKKAKQLGVVIKEYDIIYQFIEYLHNVGQGMIEEEEIEVLAGKLEVLAVFYKKGKEMIFGGKVIEGKALNGAKIKIFRDEDQPELELDEEGNPIEEDRVPSIIGTITSLQKEQTSVKEVSEGHECGMKARMSKKLVEGDIVEFWTMEKK